MPLDFIFLPDNVPKEDLFKGSPHKKIAKKLYELITDPKTDSGFTIGIEGKWGSGKSTVIEFLRQECENDDNIFVFYMDAWEHEGDHLRRIFLEEFITKAETEITKLSNDDKKKLIDIKSEATNKKITKKIKRTQKTTIYGKIAAFCMLLLPVGSAIVLKTIPEVTIKWRGTPHGEFLFGVVLLLSPFLLCFAYWLVQKIIRWLIQIITHRKNNETTSVSFWENNSNEEYTTETSQEEERSSVEFSKFFQKSLAVLNDRVNKIVCVIDNLDRINVDNALKIWSTLQTFVQNKNPTNKKENLKKLWILVPYDESGLRKLWNKSVQETDKAQSDKTPHNEVDTESTKSDKEKIDNCIEPGCAKFFFDKCFQLRVEVPPLILSGWVDYTEKMLNEAFKDCKDINQDTIMNILKGTRERIDDIPSPREIKMYINQTGFLRSLLEPEISLEAIAIYCVEKYLRDKPSETIKHQLINKEIPENFLSLTKSKTELAEEISAILFQVSKVEGMQILLQEPIETAILKENLQYLQKLKEHHQSVFWDVLNYLLDHKTNNPIEYIHSIYKAFENQEEYKKSHLLDYINGNCENIISNIKSMDSGTLIPILLVAKTAKKRNDNYRDFTEEYSNKICEIIKQNIHSDTLRTNNNNLDGISMLLDEVKKVINALNDNDIKLLYYSKITFNGFSRISNIIAPDDYTDRDIIVKNIAITDKDKLDKDIAEQIKHGVAVPEYIPKMIKIGCLSGFNNWNETIVKINESFQYNLYNNIPNIVNIQLLEALQYTKLSAKNTDNIKALLETKYFWTYVGHYQKNKAIVLKASFFLGKYIEQLHISMPTVAHASNMPQYFFSDGYQAAKMIWKNHSPENAEYMLDLANHTQNYEFIFELAKDSTNLLASDIIEIAHEKQVPSFFPYEENPTPTKDSPNE